MGKLARSAGPAIVILCCPTQPGGGHSTTSSIKHLSEWCQDRSGDEIVECLWAAGVPVAKVLQPHRQTDIPQLQFRGFFEDVGHPVNNTAAHSTVPVRFSAGPDRFHLKPAPLLGQHHHELLAEIGLNDHEIAELEAEGVIGRAPDGAKAVTR